MWTEIPKGDYDSAAPCWIAINAGKPLIKCNCGDIRGIGLHHVHEDGTVTRSFHHDTEPHPEIGYAGGGCGWHVWLKLKDYDKGDFPPVP
jgi:hypothetical protein